MTISAPEAFEQGENLIDSCGRIVFISNLQDKTVVLPGHASAVRPAGILVAVPFEGENFPTRPSAGCSVSVDDSGCHTVEAVGPIGRGQNVEALPDGRVQAAAGGTVIGYTNQEIAGDGCIEVCLCICGVPDAAGGPDGNDFLVSATHSINVDGDLVTEYAYNGGSPANFQSNPLDLSGAIDSVCDADEDTCVEVERTPDDDTIRLRANGVDVDTLTEGASIREHHSATCDVQSDMGSFTSPFGPTEGQMTRSQVPGDNRFALTFAGKNPVLPNAVSGGGGVLDPTTGDQAFSGGTYNPGSDTYTVNGDAQHSGNQANVTAQADPADAVINLRATDVQGSAGINIATDASGGRIAIDAEAVCLDDYPASRDDTAGGANPPTVANFLYIDDTGAGPCIGVSPISGLTSDVALVPAPMIASDKNGAAPPFEGDALTAGYREPRVGFYLPFYDQSLLPLGSEVHLFRRRPKHNRSGAADTTIYRRGSRWVHPVHLNGSKHSGDRFYSGEHTQQGGAGAVPLVETEWAIPAGQREFVDTSFNSSRWFSLNGVVSVPADYPVLVPRNNGATGSVGISANRFKLAGEAGAVTKSTEAVFAFAIAVPNPNYTLTNKQPKYFYGAMSEPFRIQPQFAYDGPADPTGSNRYVIGFNLIAGGYGR